jgi:RNA polymerase sigma factor (sigma-70 family)
MPTIREAARKLQPRLPRSDLEQEGVVALLQAIGDYDPACDVGLLPFARRRIREHLRRVVRGVPRAVAFDADSPASATSEIEALERDEFDARVREVLIGLRLELHDAQLDLFDQRMLTEDPVALEKLARRWHTSAGTLRRAERALLDRVRRRLSSELADSLPAMLGSA